jgi:DNA-binding transcriptional MerR regulator
MSGIRTNAAAELLGVSPNTLRSWERRFGYPRPRRTEGGHRQYELADLEALRRALLETHNISSAIEIARQRGEGPTSPARLVEAFDRFDDRAADQAMEESLAVRSVERTVEELMLPSLAMASERLAREAEAEFGVRWATGWLHAARRVVPAPARSEGVLIFDSSTSLVPEAVHVQAFELAVRRAGFRTLLLSVALEQERLTRALRGASPAAIVLAGSGATLDVVGRIVYAARRAASQARVLEYREATPVSGTHSIPSLGSAPSEAVPVLRDFLEGPAAERARLVKPGDAEPSIRADARRRAAS